MIKELDLNLRNTLKEVYDLQRASYQIEARLINFFEIPPLTESIEDLEACGETFLGYFEGETLVGAISYTVEEHELTICRMVVHPSHFRKGIAQKLLKKVEEQNQDISLLYVSTGKENPPAKNLYLKNGFQFVSDLEVVPGLYISHFLKEKHQPK
ncbi:GNAT family N-acetyltransferase [Bacillus sp. AFS076308]|uniref:GNAT family N-acetyltransferase n=1 Tax=unclassified Bacillus (in: firmicutes) TaxID=185979 RepID=UPI000BF79EB9|nr:MULTISPECIES: GNAT family N-acetyltransferase [unclassified Bacillus (in: firmicutes)]PFN97827.1 GNAT family N-acetyltransferase [Bacillus sp. AFS076308]PGV45331.1 GNAT family N-acetyltransferase [Bacillus sp. AFS037270]